MDTYIKAHAKQLIAITMIESLFHVPFLSLDKKELFQYEGLDLFCGCDFLFNNEFR